MEPEVEAPQEMQQAVRVEVQEIRRQRAEETARRQQAEEKARRQQERR